MTAATAFPEPAGYQYLVNETQMNIIRAGLEPYMTYVGGIPWLITQVAIIFLVPIYIWMKSQNVLAAGFAQLVITLFMKFYSVNVGWFYLNPWIEWCSYGTSAIMLVVGLMIFFKKEDV